MKFLKKWIVTRLYFVNFVFLSSIHEDEMKLVCQLGDQPNKVMSAKSASSAREGKRSQTSGNACHHVCVSTKHIVYLKVSEFCFSIAEKNNSCLYFVLAVAVTSHQSGGTEKHGCMRLLMNVSKGKGCHDSFDRLSVLTSFGHTFLVCHRRPVLGAQFAFTTSAMLCREN